jgi:CheY-like chemotaxis protein
MVIFFGDDEQIAREVVTKALVSSGYSAFSLNTGSALSMPVELAQLLQEHGVPDIFILDGHNVLLDDTGNRIYDMTPLGLIAWLHQNGIPENCRFILYSNDEKLVEQASSNRHLNFFDAIPKGGEKGGLKALIKAIERATL